MAAYSYEVHITVTTAIVEDYLRWLPEHVQRMLQFKGFIQARIMLEQDDTATTPATHKKISVYYNLASREDLEAYFKDHAPKMRAEALALFGEQFSATRRVLRQQGETQERKHLQLV